VGLGRPATRAAGAKASSERDLSGGRRAGVLMDRVPRPKGHCGCALEPDPFLTSSVSSSVAQ